MKVLLLGDTHFRPKDFNLRIDLYKKIIECNQGVNQVIHLGDLFDSVKVGNIDCRTEDMVSEIAKIHNRNLLPLIVVKGNHDEGNKGSALDFFSQNSLIKVINKTKVLSLGDKTCLFIPWAGSSKEGVKELLQGHSDKIDFIFGHMDIVGANNNEFIREDESKSLWCFKPEDFHSIPTFLGHIHTAQTIKDSISYLGTIEQLSFQEEGNWNGYGILDLNTREFSRIEVTTGQKYYTMKTPTDLPDSSEEFHIRSGRGIEIDKSIDTSKFLSFRPGSKIKETFKREKVVEIENKEDFTAVGLYEEYLHHSKIPEYKDSLEKELEEINSFIINSSNFKTKGIKKFNSISTKNIGKLKNQTYTFTPGINVVYGEVGSGKTTLVESLYATLYGNYPQKERKNISKLLRSPDGSLTVSLTDTEDSTYNINRKLSQTDSGVASLTKENQKEITQKKSVVDETCEYVFGNKDFMSKTCFIDQTNCFDILDKTESERMNGLRDILGLDFFYSIEEFISNKLKDIGNKKILENNLISLESNISTHTAELSSAREEITSLQLDIVTKEKQLDELRKKVNKSFNTQITQRIKLVRDKIGDIKSFNDFIIVYFDLKYEDNIRMNILNTEAEIRALKKDSVYSCENCGFTKNRSKEIKEKEIEIIDRKNDIKEIERAYSPITISDLDFIENNLTVEEYNHWDEHFTALNKAISTLDYETKESRFKLGRCSSVVETFPARIQKWSEQKTDIEKKLEEVDKWNHLSTVFGKKGVSNYIISSALNEIQEIIDELLTEVNVGFKIQLNTQVEKKTGFSETLEILLLSEDFAPYDFRSASGGEKNFIRILWKVALAIYMHGRNPVFKILIMDEPTSNSSSSWITLIQQLIVSMKHFFEQIIVVTHNEFLSSYSDNWIKV